MRNDPDQEECCPKFDPIPWDNQIIEWNHKRFIRGRVFTFNHIPFTFGIAMRRLMCRIETDEAKTPENLCLSNHTSKWNMDLYLAVDKEVKNAMNIEISGTFLSRVYEGSYENVDAWSTDFAENAQQRDLNIEKWYMWYTTCPKCAKKYGRNYVVIIAQVCQQSSNTSERN